MYILLYLENLKFRFGKIVFTKIWGRNIGELSGVYEMCCVFLSLGGLDVETNRDRDRDRP
jgi:hypothetical protein